MPSRRSVFWSAAAAGTAALADDRGFVSVACGTDREIGSAAVLAPVDDRVFVGDHGFVAALAPT